MSPLLGWGSISDFIFNFLVMIPLAATLGQATEEVAARSNEVVGGLMNCTLGNIMEVIISITALNKGYIRVVQTSLLGSVLSNMLLVLGTCFLFGGIKEKHQSFNRIGATTFGSLLLMACLGLISPSAFINTVSPRPGKSRLLLLSRICALILFLIYILYLVFQMITHSDVFAGEEDEEDKTSISLAAAITVLGTITLLVTVCSEFLVGSLQGVVDQAGLNQVFIGIILFPIIGNAAEHVSAVTMAMKNKNDLALGIAVGSSIQIALFVIPMVTLLGWMIGVPLTLDFHPFETVLLISSVLIVNLIISNGQSNWLGGAMLVGAYVMIGCAFFFYPDTPLR